MGAAPEPDSIVIDHDAEVLSPEPVSGVPAEVPSVNRPVTNEMVAVDAFDAFDTVWDTTGHSASTDAAQPEASPVDDESLGSGVDAQPLWADEIIGGADPASPTSEPTGATPLPNYDELSVASLRARLRNLDVAQVRQLAEYERAHAARADVLTMFERRIAKLEAEA